MVLHPKITKVDDDSAKLKSSSLKTVSNVVNAKAGKADPMPKMASPVKEEEEVEAEEVVSEEGRRINGKKKKNLALRKKN